LDKIKRLDITEEKSSQLEDAVIETTHNEVHRGKEIEKNRDLFSHNSGGYKSEVKVSPEAPLFGS